MHYRYIGKSGLKISVICLGTMTFGSMTEKKEAFRIMDAAYDAGINFFDTAELYPVPPESRYAGLTEEIVGEWLKTKPRDAVILASKVAGAASGWFVPPIRHGLTAMDKFHIKTAIEGSLKRLKTDYIDLYQQHWPDTVVPKEVTMEVFDELVREGKVRYIGTSNDTAWGLTKSNEIAKFKGLARFESIQNNFSLLNPRFFDSLEEVCKNENISLLPYSPLAGGILSGKYQNGMPKNARFTEYLQYPVKRVRAHAKKFYNDKTLKATEKFLAIAKKHNIHPVTLAIAYSKQFDFVASTIIGVRNLEQLKPHLDAADINLNREVMKDIVKLQKEIPYPMG